MSKFYFGIPLGVKYEGTKMCINKDLYYNTGDKCPDSYVNVNKADIGFIHSGKICTIKQV